MHKCSEFEKFKFSNYDGESTKSSPFSITTRPPFNSASLVAKHFPSDTFYTSDKKPDDGCLPHIHESRVKDPCLTRYTLKASFELVPSIPSYAILLDRKQYQTDRREHFDNDIFVTGSQCKKSQYLDIDEEEPIEILRKSCSIMTSSKGHLCVFCGKLYSRKYGLKIHLRTHTGYKPLKCKICLRAFGDPSNLNKHIRLHAQGNTPYQCTYCGKILVRRRDLVRHLKSRHPNEVLS
jgi:DNA-directed RNA polymerase subunit RPC12/RpoP